MRSAGLIVSNSVLVGLFSAFGSSMSDCRISSWRTALSALTTFLDQSRNRPIGRNVDDHICDNEDVVSDVFSDDLGKAISTHYLAQPDRSQRRGRY